MLMTQLCLQALFLTTNYDKTKIVIFRNKDRISNNNAFFINIDGNNMEIVNMFNYLGIRNVFIGYGKFYS